MVKAIRVSFVYIPSLPDPWSYPEDWNKDTPIEQVMLFDKNEYEIGNMNMSKFLEDLDPEFEIIEVDDDNS